MSASTVVRVIVLPSGALTCDSNRPLPETIGVLEMGKAALLADAMRPRTSEDHQGETPEPGAPVSATARSIQFAPRNVA